MLSLLRSLCASGLLVLLRRLLLLLLRTRALGVRRRAGAVLTFRTIVARALRRRRLLFAEAVLTAELLGWCTTAGNNRGNKP